MSIEIRGRKIQIESTPPIDGRIFVIPGGTGGVASDKILLDGADTSKSWYPLLPGDTFKIVGGTYTGITFNNLSVSSGLITVTNNDSVIQSTNLVLGGDVFNNVNIDFHNTASGSVKYGFVQSDSVFSGDKVIIDNDAVGGFKNLTMKGIRSYNNFNRSWNLYSQELPYMNGTGVIALENFVCEDCEFACDGEILSSAIDFGGFIEESTDQDKGYTQNIRFSRINFLGGNYNLTMGNCQGYIIEDFVINDCWPVANNHPRIIDVGGTGTVQRITGEHNYGPLVKVVGFNRTPDGTQATNIIRNVSGKTSRKYSVVEVHSAQADDAVWTGVTVRNIVKVLGVSAVDTGTMTYFDGSPFVGGNPPYYTSTMLDVYGNATDIIVKDCTSINPYAMEGQSISLINGPAETQTNNYLSADNTLAKINTTTFIPASDSILKGAGLTDVDLPTDYYGTTRINPPTIGAVEAL